jgi:hypothetical protein
MAEDNTVYYPVTAKEIVSAYYLDCEKTRIAVVPYPERPGSMQVTPEYPPLQEWVAQGGVIEDPKYDCLSYAKRNKIFEIQNYADNLLEENEPSYRRDARKARMLITPYDRMNRTDYEKAHYDKIILAYASTQCGNVAKMYGIDEVKSVDVPNLDWPSKNWRQ